MISISMRNDGGLWDVVIENEDDSFFAFEFSTKNDAMAFAPIAPLICLLRLARWRSPSP